MKWLIEKIILPIIIVLLMVIVLLLLPILLIMDVVKFFRGKKEAKQYQKKNLKFTEKIKRRVININGIEKDVY